MLLIGSFLMWNLIDDWVYKNHIYVTMEILTFALKIYQYKIRILQHMLLTYHMVDLFRGDKLYNFLNILLFTSITDNVNLLYALYARCVLMIIYNIWPNKYLYNIYLYWHLISLFVLNTWDIFNISFALLHIHEFYQGVKY